MSIKGYTVVGLGQEIKRKKFTYLMAAPLGQTDPRPAWKAITFDGVLAFHRQTKLVLTERGDDNTTHTVYYDLGSTFSSEEEPMHVEVAGFNKGLDFELVEINLVGNFVKIVKPND